jgi:hypothetical protein
MPEPYQFYDRPVSQDTLAEALQRIAKDKIDGVESEENKAWYKSEGKDNVVIGVARISYQPAVTALPQSIEVLTERTNAIVGNADLGRRGRVARSLKLTDPEKYRVYQNINSAVAREGDAVKALPILQSRAEYHQLRDDVKSIIRKPLDAKLLDAARKHKPKTGGR